MRRMTPCEYYVMYGDVVEREQQRSGLNLQA